MGLCDFCHGCVDIAVLIPITKRSDKKRDLRGYFRYLGANVCHRTPVPDCACAPVQPWHTPIVPEQKEGWFHVHAVRSAGICCVSDIHEHFFLNYMLPYAQKTVPFRVRFFLYPNGSRKPEFHMN